MEQEIHLCTMDPKVNHTSRNRTGDVPLAGLGAPSRNKRGPVLWIQFSCAVRFPWKAADGVNKVVKTRSTAVTGIMGGATLDIH